MPGIYDDSDPNAPPDTGFDAFPAGEHQVNGIYGFIDVDEQGTPFFKDIRGRAATKIRLRLADGSEGPPMVCEPYHLALLVRAFCGAQGADLVAKLPEKKMSGAYIIAAKAAIESCTPVVRTAVVNEKGWTRYVTGANLPTDQMFQFRYAGARNTDGTTDPLRFIQANPNWAATMYLDFEIVADMSGNPTPFAGARISTRLENPFNGVNTDASGKSQPRLAKTQRNAQTIAARRIVHFVNCFCPEVQEHDWISIPTNSPYGCDEAANPITVINAKALDAKRKVVGKLEQPDPTKQPRLDILQLVALPSAPGPSVSVAPPNPVVVPGVGAVPTASGMGVLDSRPALKALREYIQDIVLKGQGSPAFDANGPEPFSFTGVGLLFAQSDLVPLWDSMLLPKQDGYRKFELLSEEQARALMDSLMAKYGFDAKAEMPTSKDIPF